MRNFSSLARLEVPERFLWWGGLVGGVGWVGFAKSFSCQTQPLLRLGWGFDNINLDTVKTDKVNLGENLKREK